MKKRNWLNYLDTKALDGTEASDDTEAFELYPIQLANGERLASNNAIYLFDEVGAGKTISSGIIAIDYLERNPEKNVLVITTATLAKGQFKQDWLQKLPFDVLGYSRYIDVVSNDYRRLEKQKKYGLMIIDEAHLFLNDEAQRHGNQFSTELRIGSKLKGSRRQSSMIFDKGSLMSKSAL